MRRIALLSDIHANALALDAVLDDIERCGVEARYCLGDLIGYGPDPSGVIARLRDSGIPTVIGNYDQGVASRTGSCGCHYATDEARELGERSYDFTNLLLRDSDAEWLLGLMTQIRLEFEGVRVLLVHGSPRRINEYLLPDRTEEQLARLALAADADVVCHGHIHIPYHRAFETARGTTHFVSSGSVGKPKDGDPRAAWVELLIGSQAEVAAAAAAADRPAGSPDPAAADPAAGRIGTGDLWLTTVTHRVAYDIDAVAGAMRERGLPEPLIEALYRA